MKAALILAFLSLALLARGEDLSLSTPFASVAAFVSATQNYDPETGKTDMAKLFLVPEGQGRPKAFFADILKSTPVWSDDTHALVLVTAWVPAEVHRSVVGALFLLAQKQGIWVIADYKRFLTAGKYARVSADLTADTGVGYKLGDTGIQPVVTVRITRGGREYSYKASASYAFENLKLKRLDID